MSSIASPVKKIQDLRFDTLPAGKAVAVTKAVRIDGMTMIIGADGRVYSNKIKKTCFYSLGNYIWTVPVMKQLRALGVITAAQMNQHVTAATAQKSASNRRYHQSELAHHCKALGIATPKVPRATKADRMRVAA